MQMLKICLDKKDNQKQYTTVHKNPGFIFYYDMLAFSKLQVIEKEKQVEQMFFCTF